MPDVDFTIEIKNFNEGYSPLAHSDEFTFVGSSGQASVMTADIISRPGLLTQSPGLADLTNGNEGGVVDQLIRHILDKPVSATTTYAVGTTKLFKLSSTAIASGGSPSWPQTITDMTSGECVVRLKENVFVLYNKSSGGDIAAMPISTEEVDPDWGSETDVALEKAPHPAAAKEDILVFGNGRYVGVYVQGLATLDVQKLDFGEGSEVADIVFSANFWWIAVNYGEGKGSRIYVYDASAISNILSDETGIGDQKIGFLYVLNGNIFVAYEDKSSDGYTIGFISGRQIKPLRYFNGTLPDHRQKALYKNTILFAAGEYILSFGASVEQLPVQISTLCSGGYETLGALASPFGTPLIASSDGDGGYRLAKLSEYSINSNWSSVLVDVTNGRRLGRVHTVIVYTPNLLENAKCDIYLEGNHSRADSTAVTVEGEGKTRHVFSSINLAPVEDVRVVVDYQSADTANDCPIRKIVLLGNYVEQ